MSRAFVKEEDPDSPVVLPDRPVSDHPNYVTTAGYRELEHQLDALGEELDALPNGDDIAHRTRVAEIERDQKYLKRRLDSAEVIEPDDSERVRFGHRVCFEDETGEEHAFRIVGEDEADPANGTVFYASPLAKALIGRAIGDVSRWQRGGESLEIEIISISGE